jgi:hypothetical protein
MIAAMRARANKLFKLANSKFTSRSIGCNAEQLCQWLESQFKRGMTRDNYGPVWHIDHIVPLSHFDLFNPMHRAMANHYTNLRPMFAKENMSRGARITKPIQMLLV